MNKNNEFKKYVENLEKRAKAHPEKAKIEAENIFGKMRSATIEEQNSIMKGIKSISKPVGVNFWDLC